MGENKRALNMEHQEIDGDELELLFVSCMKDIDILYNSAQL